MKALVTGATGGLGRNLVERLERDGHDYVTVGRVRAPTPGESSDDVHAEFVRELLDKAEGCDVIFHCAALSSPWGRLDEFKKANFLLTIDVVAVAISCGIRLVHVSTPSIYFDFKDRHDIKEDDALPKNMVNFYAWSKLAAEDAVTWGAMKKGLKAVILRPRAIFGPYDRVLMPRLIEAAKRGPVPLINNGKAVIDVTYVDNVVEAMMLAAQAKEIDFGVFNITNDEHVTVASLIDRAFKAIGIPYRAKNVPYSLAYSAAAIMELAAKTGLTKGEPQLTRYSAGVLAYDQTLDIEKAKTVLGYKPIVSIDEGIRRYGEWYRSQSQ